MQSRIYYIAFVLALACQVRGINNSEIPSFNLLLIDSVTVVNTDELPDGKPILFVFFSPYCEHCQKEITDLIDNMNYLKEAQFYLISIEPLYQIREFYNHYKVYNHKNILIGRDYTFSFIRLFNPSSPPYLVLFDKHKKQRLVIKGEATASQIIKELNKL